MEPVQYPEVTVGGEPFYLRFEFNAIYNLKRWGFKVESFTEAIEEMRAAGQSMEMVLTLAAAALCRKVDGKWQGAGLTGGDDLAQQLSATEFGSLMAKVTEALGKASPDGMNSAPTRPVTTEPTSQVN